MPREIYAEGGYLPGHQNGPDVPAHVPPANLVAWEDLIEEPAPEPVDLAALLTAVNEGVATPEQIREAAEIIGGQGG